MRSLIVILPELASETDSFLRQHLPGLESLTQQSELFELEPLGSERLPECSFLGIDRSLDLAQGPLTVAALGADPPAGSTHFHVSPLSLQDGVLTELKLEPAPEEIDLVASLGKRLDTKTLTFIAGEGREHGLVWEGRGDLHTFSPMEAEGRELRQVLPEGDNEPALRRFIDDSINLLSELEFNQRRLDDGLQPINVLWPWGEGIRSEVPNLALTRGYPTMVFTDSLRLVGLSRLVGYRPQPRSVVGTGMNAAWREMANANADSTIVVCQAFARFRKSQMYDEGEWLIRRISDELIDPVAARMQSGEKIRLLLAAPALADRGLALLASTGGVESNSLPFDERVFEDKLPRKHLAKLVASSL